jgi:hypothetical protein
LIGFWGNACSGISDAEVEPRISLLTEEMAREVDADQVGKFFKQVIGTVVPPKAGATPPKKQALI